MVTARSPWIAATLLASVCVWRSSDAAGPAQSPATYRVSIVEMQFKPARLVVHAGDRIVFANQDLFPHTVSADSGAFDSHQISAAASWTYRTAKPGTYPYHCAYHPTMKGEVTVQ